MAELRYSKAVGRAGNPRNKTAKPEQVINLVLQEANKRGMNWMQPYQAAGIVGSFMQETGNFRQDVIDFRVRGDDGTAHGLMQWRGKRFKNLLRFAKERNLSPSDIRTQVAFAFEEGNPGSKYVDSGSVRAFNQIKASKNVNQAATAFVHAERPAGYDGNAANAHDVGLRQGHARKALGLSDKDPAAQYNGSSSNSYDYREDLGNMSKPNRLTFDEAIGKMGDFNDPFGMYNFQMEEMNQYDEAKKAENDQFKTKNPFDAFGLRDFISDQSMNPFFNRKYKV